MSGMVRWAALAACVAGGASIAAAQELPRAFLDRLMDECRADYHQVCPLVLPGGGRVGRCLADHEEELSPPCLKAVKFAYAIEVCLPDFRHFCGNVAPGGGGQAVACLADNMGSLAPACAEVVSANAPYIGGEPRRDVDNGYRGYGYRGDRDYAEGAPSGGEDRDYESDRGYQGEEPPYADERPAERGYYYNEHRPEDEQPPVYEDREPLK